jgi:hypothetical protein
MQRNSTTSQSFSLQIDDIPVLKELNDGISSAISGGEGLHKRTFLKGISVPIPPPSIAQLRPGTQGDINRLSTSLFGGPLFCDAEFGNCPNSFP